MSRTFQTQGTARVHARRLAGSKIRTRDCSMPGSNCFFLTCLQFSQETCDVVWYSCLIKNFPQFAVIHTVKGLSIVNEAEVDAFLESPCFFYDSTDIGNLISASSAFSKSSLYIWKSSVHVLLKPSLKDFEHYLASMWNEYNCAVVWTFFGIDFLWDWNENWPFPVLWPLLSFPNLVMKAKSKDTLVLPCFLF